MHIFPSSLPSVRTSQLPISNTARTTGGFCCQISTEWGAGWPGLRPGWHILGSASRQGFPLRQTVQGPLPMHTSPVKQSTQGTGQVALSATNTPHLPPLNMSVISGLEEGEWITPKNPQGKPPELLCWCQLQQGGRQFQQWKIAHNPSNQRNSATQEKDWAWDYLALEVRE